MGKRLLLVAFHFPPLQGSTGVHRALAFSRYLGLYNWEVAVLTATVGAYPNHSPDNNALIPENVRVIRALALDAKRHLSVLGRYPLSLATPDRWSSWIWPGYLAGRRLAHEWRPHAILSTFPIPSAHEIALRLRRELRIPWVADFRDPMGQDSYPDDQRIRSVYWDLENRVMQQCAAVSVTTEGTARLYRDRYSWFPQDRIKVIPNGFDEAAFPPLPVGIESRTRSPGPLVFLHSGNLYPFERDPDCFFRAVAELRAEGLLTPETARFDLRGAGHTDLYQPRIANLGLEDMVRLLPGLPYRDALREMQEADFLMLFQAENCNLQIPAKLYEYLYVRRPVVAFTDPIGDTGQLLANIGIDAVAPLHDVAKIKQLILHTAKQGLEGTAFVPPLDSVMRFSRTGTAKQLAELLDEVSRK
jgi:glycosyltransferase involved in cell wall biosynthesis